MNLQIVTEDTLIPRLPAGHITRPRLNHLWDSWRSKGLVLVTAGAGFGKTSFLAENARACEQPCRWIGLDERDGDLAVFGAHLRVAMEAPVPPGRDYDPGDGALDRHLLADVVAAMRKAPPQRLILDDVHLLKNAKAVLRLLEELIRYLPEGSMLILCGREPIEVATLKARCQGVVGALSARDLEFRPEEAAALFARRFAGAKLDPQQARRLVAQTEGWAAGLEIFLQLLDGPGRDAVDRALDRIGATGAGWFEYFIEEVLGRLDGGTREFLLRTAALPSLRAATCDSLLKTRGSGAMLESLSRRNLFTVLIDEREVVYRYHHLFRAFLRDRLRRELDATEFRNHLRRAARLLVREGSWGEAAEAYAEAKDVESAIDLIERVGEKMLAAGRYEAVERAFAQIPERLVDRHPDAAFTRARLLDFRHRWDEAEAAYRRILRVHPEPVRRVELMSLLAQIFSRHGNQAAAAAWCRRALKVRARADARVRGRIHATLGVAIAELGRLDEGEKSLHRARETHLRARDIPGAARIDYLLAYNIHAPRGEMTRAREMTRLALHRFRQLRNPRRTCYSLAVLAFITSEMGDVREARALADESLRLAEGLEQAQQEGLSRVVLGRCDRAAGDLDSAVRQFARAQEIGELLGDRDLRVLPRWGLAEVHATRGNRHAARAVALEAWEIVRASRHPIQQARCEILLGRLWMTDDLTEAHRRWREAGRLLRATGAHLELRRLMLLRIHAGDVPARQLPRAIRETLTDALEPDPALLFRNLESECAARVLVRAIELGIEIETAQHLLADLGEIAVGQLVPLTKSADEALRLRAVEILAQIAGPHARAALGAVARSARGRGADDPSVARAAEEVARVPESPLHVEALGPLRLQLRGEDCPTDRWRSARALRLFQFLLVRRFRWIHKDEVIEALWPEANPEKATANLWQSVHQLRRALEPGLAEMRDSRYVRFQNDAYRLEPGDGHYYDVAEFERALREGESQLGAGRPRTAEKQLRRALELYRGDFLLESPYEEFAAQERENLREQLLRGLTLLLEIGARANRWADCLLLARRGLEQDPFNERFHQAQVQSHLMLGHRREALARYHTYEETMMRELGMLPSAKMRGLAESITAFGRDKNG